MKINLVGYSGGGFTAQDVSQHLEELKIPYKVVTVGTPDIGVMNLNKKHIVGVIGEKDNLFNKTPIFNKKVVKGGENHDAEDYFSDPEVKNYFKNICSNEKTINVRQTQECR